VTFKYTQSHVDYVAEVLIHLNTLARRNRGVRMLNAPEVARHFTMMFEPAHGARVTS